LLSFMREEKAKRSPEDSSTRGRQVIIGDAR
jgi:hypothetical protein